MSGKTDVRVELFSDEFGTAWVVKSDRMPTAKAACNCVEKFIVGEPVGPDCVRLVRARIDWHDDHGWVLTPDESGAFEVWEVAA